MNRRMTESNSHIRTGRWRAVYRAWIVGGEWVKGDEEYEDPKNGLGVPTLCLFI